MLEIDAEQRMSVPIPGQRLNQASICNGAALSVTSATTVSASGENTSSAVNPCDAGTSAISNGWRETLGVGETVCVGVWEGVGAWDGVRVRVRVRVCVLEAPTLKVWGGLALTRCERVLDCDAVAVREGVCVPL
jgi:hypothetical protein